jgi:hypothetical protein
MGDGGDNFPNQYQASENLTNLIGLCRQFADVFDVDHFINYLKDDIRILREPPDWIPHHKRFYTSTRFVQW